MFISKFILGLAFLMASLVAISNFLVQFPVNYFGMESILTYAAFTYPITFLITDVTSEVYGKKKANLLVIVGFFSSLLSLLIINFKRSIPSLSVLSNFISMIAKSAFKRVASPLVL